MSVHIPANRKKIVSNFKTQDGYWVSPIDKSLMLLIPSGSFYIGSNCGYEYKDEQHHKEVYLCPFFMDVHKVTREMYRLFLTSIHNDHSFFCHPEEPSHKSHIPYQWEEQLENPVAPVTGIDWFDAWAYAQWAGKLLPTEAQWERACLGNVCCDSDSQQNYQHYEIQNLLGKGWEWCLDSYSLEYYEHIPRYEPCCLDKTGYKVAKGCLPNMSLPWKRASFKNAYPEIHREENLGFRCVCRVD